MRQLYTNNAKTTALTAILISDSAITVALNSGALFPNPTVGSEYL